MSRFFPGQFITRSAYAASIVLAVAILTQLLNAWVLSSRADPARQILGQRADEEALRKVRKELGLQLSPTLRMLRALNDLMPLSLHNKDEESAFYYYPTRYSGIILKEFNAWVLALKWPYVGYSYQTGEAVHNLLLRTIPATTVLAFIALIMGVLGGTFMGFIAALGRGKVSDLFLTALATLGVAAPSFLVALLAQYFLAFRWAHRTGLPLQGSLLSPSEDGSTLVWTPENIILPALVLGVRPFASVLSLVRTAALEALSSEYVKTARAKGLRPSLIYGRHILPNVLMPVVSLTGNWLAGLMGGAVFVEFVFGWNGVGKLMVDALEARDFNVVSGVLLYMALVFLVIHYLTEWVYRRLNPELRRI
jgi:peptide/nickel transport system permease protein